MRCTQAHQQREQRGGLGQLHQPKQINLEKWKVADDVSFEYKLSGLQLNTISFIWSCLCLRWMICVKYSQAFLWTVAKAQPDLHKSTEQWPVLFCRYTHWVPPWLAPPDKPLCLTWAGATEFIIFLRLSRSGCLINDTTNNICHAVTSVSSSRLAQLRAALCRLPSQIRTPLEKLFTHLSSPQAPLHFVCPPKDPSGGHYNLFQSEK